MPPEDSSSCDAPPLKILGSDCGRTDFSRIFIFGPPDFFSDFLAGFFLLIFVGKVPRKILQENPRENPPKFIQQKSSDTLLQIGWGKKLISAAAHVLEEDLVAIEGVCEMGDAVVLAKAVPLAGRPVPFLKAPFTGWSGSLVLLAPVHRCL